MAAGAKRDGYAISQTLCTQTGDIREDVSALLAKRRALFAET